MDTFNRFFPSVVERGQKQVQLPPGLNTEPEIILKILHNHRLLVQKILWPSWTVTSMKSINFAPHTTAATLERDTKFFRHKKEVTFTSLDDGVSFLEDLPNVRFRIRWTVTTVTPTYDQVGYSIRPCTVVKRPTPSTKPPRQFSFTETRTISGDRDMVFIESFGDCYDPNTERLMYFLDQAVKTRISLDDVSEGRFRLVQASGGRNRLNATKLKND